MFRKIILLHFAILLLTNLALASYISLNTTLSSRVEGKNLKIMVSSVNKGDESAFNVQAEVRVGGKIVLADKKPELVVNGSYQMEHSFPLALGKAGTYPLTLVMHYTDANQYPFSALTCQTFVYGKEVVPPLFGQIKPVTFSKEGKLYFTLKNLSDQEIKAKVFLVSPRELTVSDELREIIVSPKSQQSSSFAVKNFSALPGSTYQVFAVAEAEDKNLHYTNVFPGTIKIVAQQEILGISYSTLIIILVLLLLIFFGAQLFWKNK